MKDVKNINFAECRTWLSDFLKCILTYIQYKLNELILL